MCLENRLLLKSSSLFWDAEAACVSSSFGDFESGWSPVAMQHWGNGFDAARDPWDQKAEQLRRLRFRAKQRSLVLKSQCFMVSTPCSRKKKVVAFKVVTFKVLMLKDLNPHEKEN